MPDLRPRDAQRIKDVEPAEALLKFKEVIVLDDETLEGAKSFAGFEG